MSAGEDVAALAALESLAAEADAGGAVSSTAPGAQPDIVTDQAGRLAGEVSGLVFTLVTVFQPFFPSLREIYTKPTVEAIGAAVAPVCVKHGWTNVGGKWAEECAALAVLAPVGMATYAGVSSDLKRMKAAAEKKPPAAVTDQGGAQ